MVNSPCESPENSTPSSPKSLSVQIRHSPRPDFFVCLTKCKSHAYVSRFHFLMEESAYPANIKRSSWLTSTQRHLESARRNYLASSMLSFFTLSSFTVPSSQAKYKFLLISLELQIAALTLCLALIPWLSKSHSMMTPFSPVVSNLLA